MNYQIRLSTLEDLPGTAVVHVDTWRSTYRGIVPGEYLAQLSYTVSESRLRSHQGKHPRLCWVAAEEAGRILGFAHGGPELEGRSGFSGELYAIFVLQSCQGEGIGRRLMQAVFSELASASLSPVIIWALQDNPACAFYRHMGGKVAAKKIVEIGGKQLVALGFGFHNSNNISKG
jgi:GNAT superfamily N-acetyltransferase